MKFQVQVIDGGREALERQIVNELFQPAPISDSLRKQINDLKRRGKLTAVSPETPPAAQEAPRQPTEAPV